MEIPTMIAGLWAASIVSVANAGLGEGSWRRLRRSRAVAVAAARDAQAARSTAGEDNVLNLRRSASKSGRLGLSL